MEAIWQKIKEKMGIEPTEQPDPWESLFEQIKKAHFPGGEKQIDMQTNEIVELFDGKLTYTKAHGLLAKGKFIFSVDKCGLYDFIKLNYGDIFDADEIKLAVAYLFFNRTDDQAITFIEIAYNTENFGYDADEIPVGYGEFGRCATNPIPVKGAMANIFYLRNLRLTNGNSIKWKSRGTVVPQMDGLSDVIKIYDIFDEKKCLGEIYFAPYNQKTSLKCPTGFVLAE